MAKLLCPKYQGHKRHYLHVKTRPIYFSLAFCINEDVYQLEIWTLFIRIYAIAMVNPIHHLARETYKWNAIRNMWQKIQNFVHDIIYLFFPISYQRRKKEYWRKLFPFPMHIRWAGPTNIRGIKIIKNKHIKENYENKEVFWDIQNFKRDEECVEICKLEVGVKYFFLFY